MLKLMATLLVGFKVPTDQWPVFNCPWPAGFDCPPRTSGETDRSAVFAACSVHAANAAETRAKKKIRRARSMCQRFRIRRKEKRIGTHECLSRFTRCFNKSRIIAEAARTPFDPFASRSRAAQMFSAATPNNGRALIAFVQRASPIFLTAEVSEALPAYQRRP